jgi:pyrroline-5-carboxylate reductase
MTTMGRYKTLGFIGGGRVTRIILGGFQRNGLDFSEVVASDMKHDALSRLREKFSGIRPRKEGEVL